MFDAFLSRRARPVVALALAALTTVVPATDSHAGTRHPERPPLVHAPPGPVHDVGVNGTLPSDAVCAARVQPVAESRPQNRVYNNTRGSSPNNENSRITGNFVGTTDEIIQWAACKWGLDLQWARAQALIESFWVQTTAGDFGTDPSACLPGHPIGADGRAGQCPQSIGLLQVRYPYHRTAFEDNNAIRSTAYNADYAWSFWRRCFNGEFTWLNTVERGRTYAAGDGLGCLGVWFSGRWYTDAAVGYMNRVAETAGGLPGSSPFATAPTSLRAAVAPTPGVNSGQVRLTWNPPTSTGDSALTAYGVQWSLDGRTWTFFSDSISGSRTYVAKGLTNGRLYRFRVRAKNAAGWSNFAAYINATPSVGSTPSAPTSPRAAVAPAPGVNSRSVRLTWNPSTSTGGTPITSYGVQWSFDGVTWTFFSNSISLNRAYVATGLTNGRTYRFRIRARNSLGWSNTAAYINATPSIGSSPPAPTNLTAAVAPASGVGSGQVRFAWNPPPYNGGTPVIAYGVQWSLDGVTWTFFSNSISTNRTYLATGLTNGRTYRFRVRARNSVGWSNIAAYISAVPRAATQLAAAVTTTTTTTTTPTTPATTTPGPTTTTTTAATTTSVVPASTTTTIAPSTSVPTTTAAPTTTTAPPTTAVATTTTTTTTLAPSPAPTPFPDGTWMVGTDIQAATYRVTVAADSVGCTWERRVGFSDAPADVVATGGGAPGEVVTVVIDATDVGFVSSGCGTWAPVP